MQSTTAATVERRIAPSTTVTAIEITIIAHHEPSSDCTVPPLIISTERDVESPKLVALASKGRDMGTCPPSVPDSIGA
ncbi:hypothetical protein GCM10022295_26910 [Streptomyces osmaniensis]|uniref:Uncharacterized protein n=1 Tax=Streptomyces osmaniensis TaxID=593134 RepID=A0ABP6W262_9ACTN